MIIKFFTNYVLAFTIVLALYTNVTESAKEQFLDI